MRVVPSTCPLRQQAPATVLGTHRHPRLRIAHLTAVLLRGPLRTNARHSCVAAPVSVHPLTACQDCSALRTACVSCLGANCEGRWQHTTKIEDIRCTACDGNHAQTVFRATNSASRSNARDGSCVATADVVPLAFTVIPDRCCKHHRALVWMGFRRFQPLHNMGGRAVWYHPL